MFVSLVVGVDRGRDAMDKSVIDTHDKTFSVVDTGVIPLTNRVNVVSYVTKGWSNGECIEVSILS